MKGKTILLDARELARGKLTGIGRVVLGLVNTLVQMEFTDCVFLAVNDARSLSFGFKNRSSMRFIEVPSWFLKSEKTISVLTRNNIDLFISPYPKLPLFGCHAKAGHIVHDILDLTHPAYRKRMRTHFDAWRLKRALKRADLTWYDSIWSQKETQKFAGTIGKNPRVRYPGIDEGFAPERSGADLQVLKKYGLNSGYILVLGNGRPHKNLGMLLEIAEQVTRRIVFAGVQEMDQQYWKSQYPNQRAKWISHVEEGDLPSLFREAFCLVQPSTAEGYGYPPLEAMACGTPAVVSKIPVLLETTGSIALYADPQDPRTWMNSISILERHDVRRAQVEKGLEWVAPLKGAKGWQGHICDILELLEERI